MSEKIRVLIVDDHPLIIQALMRTFHGQHDIEVVGESHDGADAVEKVRTYSPDVIIMDLGLPGKPGVQAIREIIKEKPEARILVFSGVEDQATILEAVQSGAIGFVGKGKQEIDVVNAIRETYKGMTTLEGDGLHRLLTAAKKPGSNPMSYRKILSDRESEIVEMVAEGYSNQVIAEKIFVTESTVRSHINHALNKLDLKTRAELIRCVLQERLKSSR